MTPEEKAKKLIERFTNEVETNHFNLSLIAAKQCALICVEQIQEAIDFDWMEVQNLDRQHAYWESVKEAIIKYK